MPVGEYMFSSLKSNKSIMLDKTKRLRKTLGGYDYVNKTNFEFPEITPKIIKEIQERLSRERRRMLWKRSILFSVIAVLLILVIVF